MTRRRPLRDWVLGLWSMAALLLCVLVYARVLGARNLQEAAL